MPGICGLRKGTARIMEKLLLIHSTKEIQLQVKNVASRLKLALDIIPEEYCGCRLKELAAGKYAQNPPDTVASDSTVAEGTIPSGSAATEGTVPAPAAQAPPSCLVLCAELGQGVLQQVVAAAVDVAKRHGYHNGADNNSPDNLGGTEIRRQQSAGSQLYRHNGHSRKEFRKVQKNLIV